MDAPEETRLQRNPGRRWADHFKQKSTWALIIGVLLQGGFLIITQRLLTMGESQLNREREMLVVWHTEIVQALRDQTAAIRELADCKRREEKGNRQ